MTTNFSVIFDLDEYGVYPDLESFCIDDSSVEVRKEPGNYCTLVVNGTEFVTNELELELSGGGWTASASFDVPVTPENISDLREATSAGLVKLRLGEYEFISNKSFNTSLFDEDFFQYYGR
jgi:hypothetical protein